MNEPVTNRKGENMAYLAGKDAAAMKFQKIIYEKNTKQRGRATVTLNRPEVYNSFDYEMLSEMSAAFLDASHDDSVAVLVLTGAGDKAFCTGADLKEQQEHCVGNPQSYWKWMGAFIEAHDRLRNIGKPTVARLNGMTVGGGNEFNMACDLAVAADDIYIRQVGTARGSVPAGGATQWLPIIVGDRRAREILMLCEEIPAAKAMEWGLINQVVPRAELDSAVDAMCAKLINKLPGCIRYTKLHLNFWRDLAWHNTVQHARDWLAVNNLSYEVKEGIAAFNEKRPVDYEKIRRETK